MALAKNHGWATSAAATQLHETTVKWAPPLHWRAVPGQPRAQATAPRYGSEQVGLGWVISGGVLNEENLSPHVQAYVMHQGAQLGHVDGCQCIAAAGWPGSVGAQNTPSTSQGRAAAAHS